MGLFWERAHPPQTERSPISEARAPKTSESKLATLLTGDFTLRSVRSFCVHRRDCAQLLQNNKHLLLPHISEGQGSERAPHLCGPSPVSRGGSGQGRVGRQAGSREGLTPGAGASDFRWFATQTRPEACPHLTDPSKGPGLSAFTAVEHLQNKKFQTGPGVTSSVAQPEKSHCSAGHKLLA